MKRATNAQPMLESMLRVFARGIRVRTGEVADLETLRDIDLDAGALFERAGMYLDLPETHEFSQSERSRLHASLVAGTTLVATANDIAVGFIAVGLLDEQPYVEQISVRMGHMRQGLGGALLDAAFASFAARYGALLWLTTYEHLAWNCPFYQRRGFRLVPEKECGKGLRHELEFQRRWLPRPERRVAMCRR